MVELKDKHYTSLEELYIENRKLVFVMAHDYIADEHRSNDICSIVWAKIAEHPQRYLDMNQTHFRHYLRLIVKTSVIDYLKREEGEIVAAGRLAQEDITIHYDMQNSDFYRDEIVYLEEAVKKLNLEEKELIYMRFCKRLTARKVGEIMDMSEVNVRVKQKRILAKLKSELMGLMKEDDRI